MDNKKNDRNNILLEEKSYQNTQIASGLMITTIIVFLGWQTEKKTLNTQQLNLFRIGIFLSFVVFCISCFIIITIDNHISNVYNKVTENDVTKAKKYHQKKKVYINFILEIYKFSYYLLITSVAIILISKHNTLNIPTIFLIILTCILSIIFTIIINL